MRTSRPIAAAIAGALATAALATAGTAVAAPSSHFTTARADWKRGAGVAAADQSRLWLAARAELPHRFVHERHDLAVLTSIPLTSDTAKQRATAHRVTRELNGFFHTPGLYGVAAGTPRKYARADWINSAHVSAARANFWLAAADDELASHATRYRVERADLASLEAIPLTSTTAKQRATAHRDVRALNTFFRTPNLGR